jgi:hypothetical protein
MLGRVFFPLAGFLAWRDWSGRVDELEAGFIPVIRNGPEIVRDENRTAIEKLGEKMPLGYLAIGGKKQTRK